MSIARNLNKFCSILEKKETFKNRTNANEIRSDKRTVLVLLAGRNWVFFDHGKFFLNHFSGCFTLF